MTSKDYRQGFFVDLCETGYKDSDGTYTYLFSEDLQQQFECDKKYFIDYFFFDSSYLLFYINAICICSDSRE
jgi:hypothetical protein